MTSERPDPSDSPSNPRRRMRRPPPRAAIPRFSPTLNQPLKHQANAHLPSPPRPQRPAMPTPVVSPAPSPPHPNQTRRPPSSPPSPRLSQVRPQPEPSIPHQGRSPRPAPPPRNSSPQSAFWNSRWLGWTRSWAFWWSFAALSTIGLGLFSAAVLLKLPALPNCPAIFWPTASASLRMYCAELAANKRTVRDLLQAIDLVNRLPADHPLRPEINRLIEVWAVDILKLADEQFHNGKLETAIATARQIPAHTSAHEEVEEQITAWNEIWLQAEGIYKDSEDALRKERFQEAFSIANRLLQVPNRYWQNRKYNELNNLITITRRDSSKLTQARQLKTGSVEDILEALTLVREVTRDSYVYGEAQTLLIQLGREMLARADDALKRQDFEGAIAILNRIPKGISLGEESDDFRILAEAESKAWRGTATALEEAILHARRLRQGRPLYNKAQGLIRQWQLEIQDLALIGNAKTIAAPSNISSLQAAIAEAQRVPRGNPRWAEAQDLIADWTAMVQRIEDRPYLDRAEQIAAAGDVASLQAAINEASRISSGRALSGEAQRLIDSWRDRLQRIEDQPYLDQARRLAQQGDLPGAIATAQRIQSGRALSSEAQAEIATWQANVTGQQRMQEAYQIAVNNTAGALVSAIQTANQVPAASTARSEANRMIETWSRSLLAIAQQEAQFDVQQAIATAERIPASSGVYAEAQQYIQQWQALLRPSLVETVPLETYPNPATTPPP